MRTEIIYCSHKGNTRRVAEAIGEVLAKHGVVEVVDVDEAAATIGENTDLLLVGGPTEGHGMTPEVRTFLDRLDAESVRGKAAAAFDTRIDWPRILSGSAASGIEKALEAKGARVLPPAGSFIVDSKPRLLDGELERAREWATAIAGMLEPTPV